MKWKDLRKIGNKYVTNSAFVERNVSSKDYKSTFTLAEDDKDGYISFSKLYLSYYWDPTELRFVEDVFEGDFEHWDYFRQSFFLADLCQRLRKKAEKMRIARAYEQISKIAYDENNKNNLQALKFLVGDTIKEEKKTAGRPKKVKAEPEIDTSDLLEDVKRLKQS